MAAVSADAVHRPPRLLRVQVAGQMVDLPARQVRAVHRLRQVDWQGVDGAGRPLLLARSDWGPVLAVAAQVLPGVLQHSPQPRWSVRLRATPQAGECCVAVCDVLGWTETGA